MEVAARTDADKKGGRTEAVLFEGFWGGKKPGSRTLSFVERCGAHAARVGAMSQGRWESLSGVEIGKYGGNYHMKWWVFGYFSGKPWGHLKIPTLPLLLPNCDKILAGCLQVYLLQYQQSLGASGKAERALWQKWWCTATASLLGGKHVDRWA